GIAMRRRVLIMALATAMLLSGGLAAAGVERTQAQGPGNAPAGSGPGNAPESPPGLNHRPACPGPAAPGTARCHLQIRTDVEQQSAAAARRGTPPSSPPGYSPTDLRAAYNLPSASATAPGANQVVAIVDAFDHPKAENDLGVYR